MLLETARDNPEDVALIFMGTKIKFKELIYEVDNCAKALLEMGVTEDDAVTVCMPNTPHAVIMFYAINKVGAIANMIHPLSAPKEIEFYLKLVDSKFILIGDFMYMNLKKVQQNLDLNKVIIAKISDYLSKMMSMGFWALEGHKIPKVQYKDDKLLISWKKFMKFGYKSNKVSGSEMKSEDGAVVLYTGGQQELQRSFIIKL